MAIEENYTLLNPCIHSKRLPKRNLVDVVTAGCTME
jgi:hypothetical protein